MVGFWILLGWILGVRVNRDVRSKQFCVVGKGYWFEFPLFTNDNDIKKWIWLIHQKDEILKDWINWKNKDATPDGTQSIQVKLPSVFEHNFFSVEQKAWLSGE